MNGNKVEEVLYPVAERFYSLQGEGYNSGRAAFFIRLAGCRVGCPWCDSKTSWLAENHPQVAIGTFLEEIRACGAGQVVITGGEPLMHSLEPLTAALRSAGLEVWLETSGTEPLSGSFDWICLSPKKHKQPLPDIYRQADELKIIIGETDDFEFARQSAERVGGACRLYLQPQWENREAITPAIVEYIKAHPQWRLSLQTHKYLEIP